MSCASRSSRTSPAAGVSTSSATRYGKRTRSLGGCATCRARHVKCDETRPLCTTCCSANLPCTEYKTNLFFQFDTSPRSRAAHHRRPLFSEAKRKELNDILMADVSPEQIQHNLMQMETEIDMTNEAEDVSTHRGPFGAFRSFRHRPEIEPQICISLEAVDNSTDITTIAQVTGEGDLPETETLPATSADLDLDIPADSLFGLENVPIVPWDMTTDPPNARQTFYFTPDFEPAEFGDLRFHERCFTQNFVANSEIYTSLPDIAFHTPRFQTISEKVPQDAVYLLRHYSHIVVPLLTPFKHTKTPWHVLFVPHVKDSLACLTLGEDLDDATICAFYSTLAISAHSLGGLTRCEMWAAQACKYRHSAREALRRMLKTAYDIPKKAKYKSILMALLTMVQVSTIFSNRDQTECYMLETEKFIRLRGLYRQKSRKVRLLHHCYAFERILHESTFVCGIDSPHRRQVQAAIEDSGLIIFGQDSFSFRLPESESLVQGMTRVKAKEVGENDLHLEYPGTWDKTLYPEIFGLAEPLLFLLSRIVRLGRQKYGCGDDHDVYSANSSQSVQKFMQNAKLIEEYLRHIQNSALQCAAVDLGDQLLQHMFDAMLNAVNIYFYRRIYDLDAGMLQLKVHAVRDALQHYNLVATALATNEGGEGEKDVRCGGYRGCTRLVWPAFIAACEAEGNETRDWFVEWFNSASCKSGLRAFEVTKDQVTRIWMEKSTLSGLKTTWENLMWRHTRSPYMSSWDTT